MARRVVGSLLLSGVALAVFSGCGGTSTPQSTVSSRQVVAALRRHGIRAQITSGPGAHAPKSGVMALLNQFSGQPRPHVVATVVADPSRGMTAECRGCVVAMISDTVAHRQALWSRWTNGEPEYLTRGGRKILIARVFLVANVYLEAHRPLISRAAAAVRGLRREARPGSDSS